MKRAFSALVILAGVTPALAQEAEHTTANSAEFVSSGPQTISALTQQGFADTLASPSLGSVRQQDVQAARARIVSNASLAVSPGDPHVTYDVILQPGHYGRHSGATGTAGRLVSEQQLAAYVVGVAAQRLRQRNLNVLVVPADGSTNGLKAKAFLAVHADGSPHPCSTGPSLGYPRRTNPYAMHAIGLATSRALGYDYGSFQRDGFTANEAQYYMFHRVNGTELTGLLEVGELTCPASEDRVVEGATRLGVNVAQALDFIVKLQ